ncbi:MAG TPA: hypothetical protein VEC37_14455, partial [Bacillota bacterium]|nr:hypothetical protein [Bacillota bacterium]
FHYGNTANGHSFIEAVIDGYVGFGLWGYNNGNYRLERERLNAWQGYWLYVKRGCEIQYWPNDPPLPIPNSNIAWEAQLVVSQSELSDSANYFGMARSVAAGADNFDAEKPPAINSALKSYFALRGVEKEYGADLRPTNTGHQTWEYVVQGLSPGEARLAWNNLQQVPLNYQITLKDLQTGKEVDLRRSNAYVFQVDGETERRFNIELVAQGAQSLQITNLRMSRNPFAPLRENEVITFNLNANAIIDIKIYDWVGNLVYVHPVANASNATEFQFTWNGRNNVGRMVANGVYFCKIIARSGNAQATQVLKLAVVN